MPTSKGIGISPMLRRYRSAGYGVYTTAWYTQVLANGGTATAGELSALTTFENSMGANMIEFDRLWIHGLANSVAARVSFVNPTSTLISLVNSPTFTASQGFNGNGTTSYLNLNFNLNTQAVKYTRNSASMGIYYNEAPSGVGNGVISGGITAYLYFVTNLLSTGINDGNDDVTNLSSTTGGFYCGVRTSSTDKYGYKNGTQSTLTTRASSGLPNANVFGLALNNSGTPAFFQTARQCVRYYGSGSVDQATLATAVQTLGTTLGWAV